MNQPSEAWTPKTPSAISGTGFDEGGHCHRGNCDISYEDGYVLLDLNRELAQLIVRSVNDLPGLLKVCQAIVEHEKAVSPAIRQYMYRELTDAIAKAEGTNP